MAAESYTQVIVKQQLAQRSGQISVNSQEGGQQFIDDITGKTLNAQPASSVILANPQRINDPKINAYALDLARGYYSGTQVPPEMVEALATVAAYISVVKGVSVASLITPDGISLEVINAYNVLKPKGSQVGVIQGRSGPSWASNPTLRGSIAAAITEQS